MCLELIVRPWLVLKILCQLRSHLSSTHGRSENGVVCLHSPSVLTEALSQRPAADTFLKDEIQRDSEQEVMYVSLIVQQEQNPLFRTRCPSEASVPKTTVHVCACTHMHAVSGRGGAMSAVTNSTCW